MSTRKKPNRVNFILIKKKNPTLQEAHIEHFRVLQTMAEVSD
jgi:hypothetical protein